ncbi:MAG: TadA family conjugal transfer-associated ATPase [Actinomycetes bacterium]
MSGATAGTQVVDATDPALVERVRWRLARTGGDPTPDRVAAAVRAEAGLRSDTEVLAVLTALGRELTGAGPLAPLLAEAGVTDVLVNGPGDVWVDRGGGLERSAVRFADEAAVERLARRLAAAASRRLDAAAPYVDARLPDGTRLHAVLPPIASGGTCISLRVPPRHAFSLDDLVAAGTLSRPMAELLRALVAGRLAFVVSGGTGAGKTTLLSTLLGLVDAGERIVLVEDSGELRPTHPHVVRLESRPPNVEGAGSVTLRDLVRQALRMRPDRLVVGEVRGAEVCDLLAALNTGHEGGCGTLHANRPEDVPARLEALAAMAGTGRAALHSQLAAALHAVVHITRRSAGVRQVSSVGAVIRDTHGFVNVVPALCVDVDGTVSAGPGADRLAQEIASRASAYELGPRLGADR